MGREERTHSANGKRDAEARSRLAYFPDVEDCREQEEKREDDCCWDGGHVLPEVVGSSVCFEFGHVKVSGCVVRVCRWVLDID